MTDEQNNSTEQVVDIDSLRQDTHNFNRGTEQGQQLMEKSFSELGAGRSILVDKNGQIIAGNKSQKAAKAAGIKKVRIIETTGDELVAVKRTDIDIDSAEGRKMALLDNLTTQVNLAWDPSEINAVSSEIEGFDPSDYGFDPSQLEVAGIGDGTTPATQSAETEAKEDDFDPDAEHYEPKVKRGEVWLLGRHRLMCGDSTSADDVARLMNGERADCVFTDPPYGINLDGDYTGRGGRKLANFKDDSTEYATKAFDIVQDMGVTIQVWFGANYYCHHLPQTNNWLIWDKRGADGVENTNSDAELAWVKDGHDSCRVFRHLWMGMVKASEHGEKRIHPTQKPIALWSYCFERYAPDATICLDLFGGSGSTLIACEQLNRQCRMMELDPHYCDVIIARWEKLTGEKAQKLESV